VLWAAPEAVGRDDQEFCDRARFQDGGNELLQAPTTLRAVFNANIEHSLTDYLLIYYIIHTDRTARSRCSSHNVGGSIARSNSVM
jgi:hypothetical protein